MALSRFLLTRLHQVETIRLDFHRRSLARLLESATSSPEKLTACIQKYGPAHSKAAETLAICSDRVTVNKELYNLLALAQQGCQAGPYAAPAPTREYIH